MTTSPLLKKWQNGLFTVATTSLPLVGSVFAGIETACALDVLFLRRDGPGSLIKSGGDIDNRLKVLFDALKLPRPGEFDSTVPPAPDEDPFFCLVEDDTLITEIKVTTTGC